MKPFPLDILYDDAARVAGGVDLTPLTNKAVLVTGASGLIGLNLIAALMRSPVRWIMGASRFGLPPFCRPWLDDPRFIDLRFEKQPVQPPPPDFIIHGAGYAQPAKFTAQAIDTLRVNVSMTDRLLAASPNARLLFLSSSEVYSGSKSVPHVETDIGCTDPSHPRAAYIEGKRCGEAIVNAWRGQGANAAIARVCLAYGPGVKADDSRALSEIVRGAVERRHVTLRDSGAALRAWCYVSDAVEMVLQILLRGSQPLYNVGGERAISVRAAAGLVAAMEDAMLEVPASSGTDRTAPYEARVDIRRYLAEFPGKVFVPLDEGLRRTIAWHKAIA